VESWGEYHPPVDYLIVGAGSAGCVVASRLAATGASVTLLEAGPSTPPSTVTGVDFLAALAEPGWTWPNLTATRHASQQPRPYYRGRGIGGSSAVNALVSIDGLPADYDRWELPGWGYADLAHARSRAHLPTETAQPGAVGQALIHAVHGRGVPVVADACAELGVGPTRLAVRHGRRMSAADAYDLPRVEIRTDSLVDRVLFEGRKATGVRLADRTEIGADMVVLAAGAIHTPSILLRSGIDRPGIGANLQDHASLTALIALRPGYQAQVDVPSATALARLSSGSSPAALQLIAFDHLGPDRTHGLVMVGLMDVRSRGHVTLRSADPYDDPTVSVQMTSDPDGLDMAALKQGLDLLLDVVTSGPMRQIADAVYLDDQGTTPEGFDRAAATEFIRRNLSDYVHPVGTCAMGLPTDPDAVVDLDGNVIGLTNLRIADASVIPRLPRANTHVPVTVVAEELARRWTSGRALR
jgi:choline dehydrogenase-like flavoprotein